MQSRFFSSLDVSKSDASERSIFFDEEDGGLTLGVWDLDHCSVDQFDFIDVEGGAGEEACLGRANSFGGGWATSVDCRVDFTGGVTEIRVASASIIIALGDD